MCACVRVCFSVVIVVEVHLRKLIAAHQSECPSRAILCLFCSREMPFDKKEEHEHKECPAVLVECNDYENPGQLKARESEAAYVFCS